ncbi:OmpA family protein [Maribellus comscasis]|nr:OmpA family protein [Maribellus comscasis]
MKKVFLLLLAALPFFGFAQNDCDFFDHTTIQIEKTNINTSASDFGPSFVENELWYSAFTDEEISKLSAGESKDIFYNLFVTALNLNGDLQGGKKTELEEISSDYHAGPVSYCPATKELFVTLSNYDNPEIKNKLYRKANVHLKTIVVKKVNGTWSLVEELPFNDATYSVGHPAITAGGKVLYFVSDMPGGQGGTDIYKSVKENGVWGEPVNLGATINTSGNEMFPYVYQNEMLFFASSGINASKDDLDIYYSCFSGNSYTTPVALNELNTNLDDFGLVIHKDAKVGYFVSKKDGGQGDDDIYKVILDKGEYKLELLVRDKKTQEPIPSAAVSFSDGEKLAANAVGIITRALDYETKYTATSELEGYMNESISFSTAGEEYGIMKLIINVEKVEVGQKFVMENIFYDFDKWDILPASEIELDKLVKVMEDNPSWKVELGSHTDSRGSDAYNEKLSQKRSESAVGYIVSKGISRDRIIAKGYGETQLVNQCDDGVPCSDEEHQMNRRTEFKILGMDK